MHAPGLQALDDPVQVGERAGQAVERDDDEGVAGAEPGQDPGEDGPVAVGAGGGAEQCSAPSCTSAQPAARSPSSWRAVACSSVLTRA